MAAVEALKPIQERWNEIEDILPVIEKFAQYKPFSIQYSSLSGRAQKKYAREHDYELSEFQRIFAEIRKRFPDKKVPTVKMLTKGKRKIFRESITTMKSSLGEAVRYALNEKKNMYSFLECPDVPVDNNRAENCIRPYTVGRKNWLHCNTPDGATASAIWYSIISTAYANGLNVEKYLSDLFSNPAGTILLPWNEK